MGDDRVIEGLIRAKEMLDAQPVDGPRPVYLIKSQCAHLYGQQKADNVWRDFGIPAEDAMIFWEDGRITRPNPLPTL